MCDSGSLAVDEIDLLGGMGTGMTSDQSNKYILF